MEHAVRASTIEDALSTFLVGFEQGLYNARAQGSLVTMPRKLNISGFYSQSENLWYVSTQTVNPEVTEDTVVTHEQAVTTVTDTNPTTTETNTTVHPEQTVTQSREGADIGEVDHIYDVLEG